MRAIFVSRDQNLTLELVPRDAGEPSKGLESFWKRRNRRSSG